MQDLKMRHQTAGVENAGNDIVWNAAHCLCLLSFAERDARLAFVPRGHQWFCASCVAQLEQQARGCPICRTDINMVLRLY